MLQCSSEPPELASKWDLTVAVDLLESPAHNTPHHSVDYEFPIPSKWRPSHRNPKLGDFSPILNVFSQASESDEEPTLPATTPSSSNFNQYTPQPARVGAALKRDTQDSQDSDSDEEPALPATTPSFSNIDQHTPQPARTGTVPKRNTRDHIPPSSKIGAAQSTPAVTFSAGTLQQPGDRLADSRPSSNKSQVLTTLYHAADTNSTGSDDTIRIPPRNYPISMAGVSHAHTPAVNRGYKNSSRLKYRNTSQPAMFSESGTDADSDSTTIIFDQPVTRKGNALAFVPTQLGTAGTRIDHNETPPSSMDDGDCILNDDTFPNVLHAPKGIQVLPAAYKDSTARLVGLMTKLLHEFPEYAKLLSQVGRLSPTIKGSPVHVFVDMSNIIVGFKEAVKLSRNIPITTRIPRLHMSFFNLSLIMERARPATKRVLVGSDRLPYIDEAEKLGYEANILDRVKKNSVLRPSKSRKGPGSQPASGGPEMAGATGSRWVEQGVDEILHLKILESLLDTDVPATMVLATGDAAEAEYSGGFLRMVERALQRGWTVELVSFSRVTSKAYHRKEFRENWGPRFQVIDLDNYLEELCE